MFASSGAPTRSHTAKKEEQVLHGKCILKPRNASVIAIYDDGCLGLRHEGTLPKSKSDELHEYFTVPQFEQVGELSTRHSQVLTCPRAMLLLPFRSTLVWQTLVHRSFAGCCTVRARRAVPVHATFIVPAVARPAWNCGQQREQGRSTIE